MADGSSHGRIIQGTLQDYPSFDLCIFSQEQSIDICQIAGETDFVWRKKSRYDLILTREFGEKQNKSNK
ncbi:hypothetical protein HAX54_007376, partial [Datura stramonium]|nr:hypothetical protein [Datura stramonium]